MKKYIQDRINALIGLPKSSKPTSFDFSQFTTEPKFAEEYPLDEALALKVKAKAKLYDYDLSGMMMGHDEKGIPLWRFSFRDLRERSRHRNTIFIQETTPHPDQHVWLLDELCSSLSDWRYPPRD